MFSNLRRYPAYAARRRREGFPPPSEPHFDDEATTRFKDVLAKATSYVEYGSGGSTVLASHLGVPTVSIENDARYAIAVRSVLAPSSSVDLVVINTGPTLEWGTPLISRPAIFWRRVWLRYAEAPYSRTTKSPDFILVDGRSRVACVLASARAAYQAETLALLMLDDYVERPSYHILEKWLGGPELVGRAAFFRIGTQAVSRELVREHAANPA